MNFNKNTTKHIMFLLILYLYYVFPFIVTGSLLTFTGDNLNGNIVYNYIAGKIILGDFDSIRVFLGGELPWQFLKGIFYPITIIYSFLDAEKAFWITDIILKSLSYFSFFYLFKKINRNSSYNYLLALLFASSILYTTNGLGLITVPYLVGLSLKSKDLKLKHYLAILFIGLNSDLYLHGIYIIPILFSLFFIFNIKNNNKNFKNLLKLFLIYSVSIFAVNSQLIYSIIYLRPFHSEETIREIPNLLENLKYILINLYGGEINVNLFKSIFLILLIPIIYLFSFLKKYKINIYILFLILITSFFSFIVNIDFINELRSRSGLLQAINFDRFNQFYFFFYIICLFNLLNDNKFKFRKYLSILIIFSIFYNLISVNGRAIFANFFNYYQLKQEDKLIIQSNYNNLQFISLYKNLINFNKNKKFSSNSSINSYSSSSFKLYYEPKNYKFIKEIVKDDRILSIGKDPMKAIINDISVIDGYHYLYPLSYKKKFKKIFSLDGKKLREYEDFSNWGHRLQISSYDLNTINLEQIKILGANYILSNKLLNSDALKLICDNCNQAENFKLYKIN